MPMDQKKKSAAAAPDEEIIKTKSRKSTSFATCMFTDEGRALVDVSAWIAKSFV